MRILYIATSFPEPEKGATIYTDLAESLYAAGHDITIAVSEQTRNKQNTEMKKERGFDVLRIVTGNYYDVGYIEKGVTTLKIPVLMRKGIKKYIGNRTFDFILFEAPPVTNAGLVAWAKEKFNCLSYLMLKDIFPQNAVDLGIMKGNGLLFRYFSAKEKKLFQTADYIGCMSPANKQYVIEHNSWLNPEKVEIFPNTKKLIDVINLDGFPMRKRYRISKEACVFLFGGNMGRPQCINFLCEAIKKCKEDDDIYFLFVGRGTDISKLEQTIKENDIRNALVIENLPRNEYEQITKECDVGLIVLDPRFTIPNYPSRILSYMEYGKPVLAATDKVTDIKELIEEAKCGEWVWSGDVASFIYKVREMSKSDRLSTMGANGRKYIEDKFDVKYSVKILQNILNREDEDMFKDKTLLITGGTGSFGNAVLSRFLVTHIGEIRIFSRDEKKQDDMRHIYNSDKIKYYIGDVRDLQSIKNAMNGVDYVFHAAALKQVPSCEFFPLEAVKTNVIGTDNVLTACVEAGVKKVICLSTDKAAYPVNAMGTSKAMMEKVFVAKSRTVDSDKTLICGTRYGNVMCSRGSVIPLFIEQIKGKLPLTVTEPKMTRFIMSLEEAVELVIFAFENAENGDIMVQKASATTIEVLAQAVKELFHADNEIKGIGIRHGEKMYETLLTNEECSNAIDMNKFYRVPADKRDLNYDKYFKDGNQERAKLSEFNSNNTELLTVEQTKKKLLTISYIREEIKAWESR